MIGHPIVGNRWIIEKEAACYRCHKGATQLIEITPSEAMVVCTNCLSERHYLIHGIEPGCHPQVHDCGLGGSGTDSWHLSYTDNCVRCGKRVDNEVNVGERQVKTACPSCCFTRMYEFNMLNESRGRR